MRLASNARRGGRLGALLLMISVLASVGTADAGASEIIDRTEVPKVSKVKTDRSRVVVHTMATPASAAGYWTPARMAAAEPLTVEPPQSAAKDVASTSATVVPGDFTPESVSEFPERIHGKIFFKSGLSDYSCSGTIVSSKKRNVAFTAGHCVFDEDTHLFVRNLIFVPGYKDGLASLNTIYSATRLYTTSQWFKAGNLSYDIGVVELDRPAEKEFGARQIAFDLDPIGREITFYGYPAKPNPPFDGQNLQGCHSTIDRRDNTTFNPRPLRATPCSMRGGSSGGGWVTMGNYVNSVMSYTYCDEVAPRLCGYIFGPYFSNAAKALYVRAGGSPGPTVELLAAPPRVVRKRKVAFKFGGTASTLLSFSCRLDRQASVPCSSKIWIARLRPGRHKLRVRAVDQTGRKSRTLIVSRFRVVLPRR